MANFHKGNNAKYGTRGPGPIRSSEVTVTYIVLFVYKADFVKAA